MEGSGDMVSMRRIRSSAVSTVVSVSLVLFLLGILGFTILHARRLSDYVKENIGFTVIFNKQAKEVDILQYQKMLDAAKYIKSTEYIDKNAAAEILEKDYGEDFVNFLGYNPLHASIDVYLSAGYANPDSIAWIEKLMHDNSLVKEVFYQRSLIELVNKNVRKISLILLVFSALLFIIAIALINHTIRMVIYSKRFLIRTMQLVGATHSFISRPFVLRGVMHGIYGALIADILLLFAMLLLKKQIPELTELQDMNLFLILFGGVMLLGIFITWLCTQISVKRYLLLSYDKLF